MLWKDLGIGKWPRCRLRIILEWILDKQCGKLSTGFICVRIGTWGGDRLDY